ncbi:MAG TPA: hypothetical protein V6C97_20895 [Oculatellaceae cyanobacterium]
MDINVHAEEGAHVDPVAKFKRYNKYKKIVTEWWPLAVYKRPEAYAIEENRDELADIIQCFLCSYMCDRCHFTRIHLSGDHKDIGKMMKV